MKPIYARMETALKQKRNPEWWLHLEGDIWINKEGGEVHKQWLFEVDPPKEIVK